MSNIRLVPTNLADTATLSISTTAGTLAASNLQLDEVAAVARSTGTTWTITATWNDASPQSIDSVILAWCNFSATATMRVRGYSVQVGSPSVRTLLVDTTISPNTGGAALAGVPLQAMCWLDASYSVGQVTILITDTSNTAGYVQASRLIIGNKFSPTYNAPMGLQVTFADASKPVRAESGDLRTDRLAQHRAFNLDLQVLSTAAERNAVTSMIAQGQGTGIFVSVFPGDTDYGQEQLGAFWAALTRDSALTRDFFPNWRAPLVFEEMGAI